MDTVFEVTVVTRSGSNALKPLWNAIDSLLGFWDEHYSQSNPKSEIFKINRRSSPVVAISPVLGAMIATALAWGDSTRGRFDLTILPVKELWGLGETDTIHRIPSDSLLAATIRRVNYKAVHLNAGRDTVRFDRPDIMIDAGGFAKGFSMIETGSLLDKRHFTGFLVVCGDVISRGKRCDGKPWMVGVLHPRKTDELLATVELDSGAIFTSGDYEHFWMAGTRRIHHIFNPKTGCSCTRNQSLTIHADDPLAAKYLSTGLFCLPADSILSFVRTSGIDCLVVDSLGQVFVSPSWSKKVNLLSP